MIRNHGCAPPPMTALFTVCAERSVIRDSPAGACAQSADDRQLAFKARFAGEQGVCVSPCRKIRCVERERLLTGTERARREAEHFAAKKIAERELRIRRLIERESHGCVVRK